MKFTLEKNALIKEATALQEGKRALREIGSFLLVFMMVTLGELILMLPFILVMAISDPSAFLEFLGVHVVIEEEVMTFAFSVSDAVASNGSAYLLILSLFATLAMIGVTLYYSKKRQNRSLRTLGFIKENAAKEYLKGLLFGFLMIFAVVLICLVTGAMTIDGLSESFTLGLFILFVIGFMIQGMAEEVLMRGYFLVSYARGHSVWAAVIVNSVLFAALHLFNSGITLLSLLNLTLAGIFLSIYFVKSGNIWAVGAFHSIWNLAQGNIFEVEVSGMATSCSLFSSTIIEGMELINGGSFGLEGGLAVTIVLIFGILVLFLKNQDASNAEIV